MDLGRKVDVASREALFRRPRRPYTKPLAGAAGRCRAARPEMRQPDGTLVARHHAETLD